MWRSPSEVRKSNVGADTLKPYFSVQHLLDIQEKFQRIEAKADRLLLQYVGYPFKNGLAKEYANHGFGRRVGTLRNLLRVRMRYQRRPQPPLHLLPHPPPPRKSRTTRSSSIAPMVALTIALITPVPRWMPS
jgi:hypothetical protein